MDRKEAVRSIEKFNETGNVAHISDEPEMPRKSHFVTNCLVGVAGACLLVAGAAMYISRDRDDWKYGEKVYEQSLRQDEVLPTPAFERRE